MENLGEIFNIFAPGDGGSPGAVAPSQVSPPFMYHWSWPQPPFVYTYTPKVKCGPIYDPYCPDRTGLVGLPDVFGYPTCCCPRSGNCHTPSVVPVGDPPGGIVTYPLGPFAYLPPYKKPPF